jgi:hypothetical protein
MKVFAVALALFAAVSVASSADERAADLVTGSQLERRGCGPHCGCDNGQCNCAVCDDFGCSWYFDGRTC